MSKFPAENRKDKNNIKNFAPVFLLFLFSALLAFQNYAPGTVLSGWDTLHPEFDFSLNIQRVIFGVFRQEQGLGAVAAHSHMADLPRIVTLFTLQFLPKEILRYLYIFFMLIIGPVGMYFFLYKIVLKNKISAFLGGLFYLLNLGTLQQFIVPFEMFNTQYGFLPWLFLIATIYLHQEEGNRKLPVFFSIVTFLATPMAYAATLWYIYFIALSLYLIGISLPSFLKRNFLIVKKGLILLLITLFINSFWILPNLYFVKTQSSFVTQAQSNKIFSGEAFLRNKEFGTIKDILFLKGFLFDWSVYAGKNNFENLLSYWIDHAKKPLVEPIGFLIAGIMLAGITRAFLKKQKALLALFPVFLMCVFFLINDNFPTSFIYNLFKKDIPLFSEAFRFPQNKVLIIYTFVFAVYFGYGQHFLLHRLSSLKPAISKAYAVLFVALLLYFMLPAFSGQFISPYMKVKIPDEYFQLFNWFNKQQNNERIANLPIHSLFGWEYYDWYKDKQPSFQGAGFLWFGIKQPLLDREFDRWSSYNEQYYREMSYAIYSQNPSLLASIIKKYEIAYILLDTSVIAPESDPKVLFYAEIKELLQKLENESMIKKDAQFGNHLFVYKTISPDIQSNAYLLKNPALASPATLAFYEDFNFQKYGPYIAKLDKQRKPTLHAFTIPFLNSGNLNIDITDIPNSLNDCQKDPPGNPSSEATKIIKNAFERFIEYSSQEGPFCDHFSYQNLNPDKAYLFTITSRNIKGLPLRVCITSHFSKRCDIYAQLLRSKDFIQEIFLLPPMKNGNGFDININNFGIKGTPSVNHLKSIQVTPFDYSLLAKAEDVQIKSKDSSEVLVLPQSYDNGWKAYKIELKGQKSKIKSFLVYAFPFLFGKELKEHVLVNNWANGWILDNSLDANSYTLVIAFLPQYLEYAGLILLIGGVIFLLKPAFSFPNLSTFFLKKKIG